MRIYTVLYGMVLIFILGGTLMIMVNDKRLRNDEGLDLGDKLLIGLLLAYLPIMLGALV